MSMTMKLHEIKNPRIFCNEFSRQSLKKSRLAFATI